MSAALLATATMPFSPRTRYIMPRSVNGPARALLEAERETKEAQPVSRHRQRSPMQSLCDEVLVCIFANLDGASLHNAGRVCSAWRTCATSSLCSSVWLGIVRREIGVLISPATGMPVGLRRVEARNGRYAYRNGRRQGPSHRESDADDADDADPSTETVPRITAVQSLDAADNKHEQDGRRLYYGHFAARWSNFQRGKALASALLQAAPPLPAQLVAKYPAERGQKLIRLVAEHVRRMAAQPEYKAAFRYLLIHAPTVGGGSGSGGSKPKSAAKPKLAVGGSVDENNLLLDVARECGRSVHDSAFVLYLDPTNATAGEFTRKHWKMTRMFVPVSNADGGAQPSLPGQLAATPQLPWPVHASPGNAALAGPATDAFHPLPHHALNPQNSSRIRISRKKTAVFSNRNCVVFSNDADSVARLAPWVIKKACAVFVHTKPELPAEALLGMPHLSVITL